MAGELSNYIQDTSALLHDYSNVFTPEKQLIRWINEARRQVAQRTGCIMRLVSGQSAFGASSQPGVAIPGAMQPGAVPGAFPAGTVSGAAINTLQTIPGVERYPFQGFFNPYLKAQYDGMDSVIDAATISINWGGAVRPTINWIPWEYLQAYGRAYSTIVQSYPYYWSVYNDGEFGEIYLFPTPSTTGDIELNAYCAPAALTSNDSFDAIPPGFRNAIKYGAAEMAFFSTYRYQEAQVMGQMFAERLGNASVSRDRGKIPSMYYVSA